MLRTDTNPTGHGTATYYPSSVSSRTNCDGDAYGYAVVNMDEDWQGVVEYTDPVTGYGYGIPCGPDDCQRYRDWHYRGYEKISDVDWSQNCHGCAFGVGDWPDFAVVLLNEGAFQNGAGRTACYELSGEKDAEIAADPWFHSIKVFGGEYEAEMPSGSAPNPGPAVVEVIEKSLQQFRESGVYKQVAECPDSVPLKKSDLLWNRTFKRYKKRGN